MSLKPKPPWNVLIWPADTEDGFAIHYSLREAKEVILHGATNQNSSPAHYNFSRLHSLPPLNEPTFEKVFADIIKFHKIDAIFPGSDDALLWLAQHKTILQTAVLTPAADTAELCHSPDALAAKLAPRLPTIVNPSDIEQSYNVHCFSQTKGVLSVQICSDKLSSVENELKNWASIIAAQLQLTGAWSFLVDDSGGKLQLIGVTPRITRSMARSHATGPNFALLSLYDAAGYDLIVDTFPAKISMGYVAEPRFLYNEPIDALYVDFDGSLILRGHVNARLMALIYQCHNRKIPVILLTRHPGDLKATMDKHHLNGMFTHVVHITDLTVPKAAHIHEKNAVLVDDSFQERHDTYKRIGIRCFDPAAALCLIDHRDGVIDG